MLCKGFVTLLVIFAACPAARAASAGQLRQRLADDGRFSDILTLALTDAAAPTCANPCQASALLNAARASLYLGELESAHYYAKLSLELATNAQPQLMSHALLAYISLLAENRADFAAHKQAVLRAHPERDISFTAIAALDGPTRLSRENRDLLAALEAKAPDPKTKEALKAYVHAPFYSPVAAGTLSAVLPGAGFAYLGMWQSAGISLALTGVSALTSAELYRRGLPAAGTSAALIGSVFYVGGILSSARAATDLNLRERREPERIIRGWALPELNWRWDF